MPYKKLLGEIRANHQRVIENLNAVHDVNEASKQLTHQEFFDLHKALLEMARPHAKQESLRLRTEVLMRLWNSIIRNPEFISKVKNYSVRNILHQGNTYDCMYHSLANLVEILYPDINFGMAESSQLSLKRQLIEAARKIHDEKSLTYGHNLDHWLIESESVEQFVSIYLRDYKTKLGIGPIEFLEGIFTKDAIGILNIKGPEDTRYATHSVLVFSSVQLGINPRIELVTVDSLSVKNMRKVEGHDVVDPYFLNPQILFKEGNSYHLILPKSER